jgi:hypothetical protein
VHAVRTYTYDARQPPLSARPQSSARRPAWPAAGPCTARASEAHGGRRARRACTISRVSGCASDRAFGDVPPCRRAAGGCGGAGGHRWLASEQAGGRHERASRHAGERGRGVCGQEGDGGWRKQCRRGTRVLTVDDGGWRTECRRGT